MAKQSWKQPSTGINYSPPNDFVPESDKTSDWFCQYARWAVAAFYNQPRQRFHNSDVITKGLAQESIENWSYVFGEQHNYNFKYITTDFNGDELPVPWLPGGKIGSLIDHMKGLLLSSVENIEVTAKNLSKDVASQRAILYEKLMLRLEVRDLVKDQLPEGVSFEPINDPSAELDSEEDIDQYVEKWQDKYSIMAEKIGESQVYQDNLQEKFMLDGVNQFVGGISGMLTEVEDGFVTNTVIPDYEVIWDNRNNDPWNSKAFVCGYVKHDMPYQEVIRKYNDYLTDDEKTEIREMAVSGYENIDDFYSFYNTGFGGGNAFKWWGKVGASNMTIATATVYFIAPRDWGYKKGNNRYGSERIKKTLEPGDFSGWDVHMATLIGNKYIVNYGYMPNTLREQNKKGRPILPMSIYCNAMALNQGKSIVRKLIPLQDEMDMYAFKIREKVAKDVGKVYVFNGNKFPGITSTEAMNDLKSIGVLISDGGSGEADDPQNAQRMVESINMELDSNIIRYLELRREAMAEMEMITSTSRIALGQQPTVIGKAVQENTIAQNSTGTASLMWGLMKHFNKIVQYNVNLKQMLYSFKDTVEEALVIGDEGSFLLKVLDPKEFGTQPLMVYINIASTLDPAQRAELRTIALSEAQNGKLDTVDYVENILMAPTLNQAIRGLKRSKNKQIKELRRLNQEAQAGQQQAMMAMEAQKTLDEAAILQLKEDNANYREQLKMIMKDKELSMQQGTPAPPPPISPLQMALSQELQAQQQQAQQQQAQQQQAQQQQQEQAQQPNQ